MVTYVVTGTVYVLFVVTGTCVVTVFGTYTRVALHVLQLEPPGADTAGGVYAGGAGSVVAPLHVCNPLQTCAGEDTDAMAAGAINSREPAAPAATMALLIVLSMGDTFPESRIGQGVTPAPILAASD